MTQGVRALIAECSHISFTMKMCGFFLIFSLTPGHTEEKWVLMRKHFMTPSEGAIVLDCRHIGHPNFFSIELTIC